MNHEISLETAVAMTSLYRSEKENIIAPQYKGKDVLAICETFGADAIRKVIDQPGCAGMRVYYGMDKELKVHAILVGVNEKDEDMLPAQVATAEGDDEDDVILEEGFRCPTNCPPPSPLNG